MTRRPATRPLPWLALLVIAAVLIWRFFAPGAPSVTNGAGDCGDKFAYARPQVNTPDATAFLCRQGYAVLHDDVRKVPLYSAEHLQGRDLTGQEARTDNFQADPDLPPGQRAELNDYRKSGYDRGHMAPAADFSGSKTGMDQSFLLSNMVPQNGDLNRHVWAGLEGATRACAKTLGDVHVLTGPIFDGRVKTIGPDRVEVPDMLYKIVVGPRGNSRAFLLPNKSLPNDTSFARYEVPIAEIERLSGITFFPGSPLDTGKKGNLCPGAYGS